MKIKLATFIGILLAVVLVSGAITYSLTNVTIEPKEDKVINKEVLFFDCGKDKMNITLSEPDGTYDENDIEYAIRRVCDDTATNIQMNGIYWKENKYGFKSFNETKLEIHSCYKQNSNWDSETNTCKELNEGVEL